MLGSTLRPYLERVHCASKVLQVMASKRGRNPCDCMKPVHQPFSTISAPTGQTPPARVVNKHFEALSSLPHRSREPVVYSPFKASGDVVTHFTKPVGVLITSRVLAPTRYEICAATVFPGDRLFDADGETSAFTIEIDSDGQVGRTCQFLLRHSDLANTVRHTEIFYPSNEEPLSEGTADAVVSRVFTLLRRSQPAAGWDRSVEQLRVLFLRKQ